MALMFLLCLGSEESSYGLTVLIGNTISEVSHVNWLFYRGKYSVGGLEMLTLEDHGHRSTRRFPLLVILRKIEYHVANIRAVF
jgi:hypothetical protein